MNTQETIHSKCFDLFAFSKFDSLRVRTRTLVPEVFFRHKETRDERERSGDRKPLVAGDAYDSCQCKVPPIRRQGQIWTLVQIYWRGKINQLSRAPRGFLTSSLFSLSSPLRASLIVLLGSSLRKPLAPRVTSLQLAKLPVSFMNVFAEF